MATLRRVFYIVDTTSRTIKHGFLRTLDKLSHAAPRARRRTIYAICRRAINPHLRTRPPTACTTAAASFKSALFSLASAIARRYRGNGAIRICGGRNCPRAICTLWVRLFLRNTAHQRAMFSLPSATCEHTRALWASAIARRYRGNGAIRICGGRNCPRAICTLWVRLFLRNTAHQRAMFSLPSATCEHTRALWASAIARRYRGNGAIRICRAPISAKYGAPFRIISPIHRYRCRLLLRDTCEELYTRAAQDPKSGLRRVRN